MLGLTKDASFPTSLATTGSPRVPVPTQGVFISNTGRCVQTGGEPPATVQPVLCHHEKLGTLRTRESPADADLVFEIRFTAPASEFGKVNSFEPQLGAAILDAKTHFILWSLIEPVAGAFRKGTWEKNVNQGVNKMMDDFERADRAGGRRARGYQQVGWWEPGKFLSFHGSKWGKLC
jgi:hypothetical protein